MIDFIGDIHGHVDKLEELLQKLGYSNSEGFYTHSDPGRKVLFVGDYIDRGPKIPQTLEIVKSMTDHGSAIALMGNREYNALCFHAQEREGGHLRKHLIKNIIQHYETLKQFQNRQSDYEEYIDWFKTLPLFLETDQFRAVHACWNQKTIDYLKTRLVNNCLTDDLIYESAEHGSHLNEAIENSLKGIEIKMPKGSSFKDKDGTIRTEMRIKWWENPAEMTYKEISVEALGNLPEISVDLSLLKSQSYYKKDHKPIFFGHYWLKTKPQLYRENICCLDFSVAKGGYLVAYRFNGESKLNESNFTFVENFADESKCNEEVSTLK